MGNPDSTRRRPRQARSKALVDAILDAAAQVLSAEGPERTTTNRIAERAGVSVGSIYQYFPDKQALYTALGERYVERLRSALSEVWPAVMAAPPGEILPRVLGGLLEVSTRDPILSGMLHLTAIPPRSFEPIAAFERDLEQLVAALLRQRPDATSRPVSDPDLAARVIVRAVGGIVGRTLATEPELVGDPRFAAEIARLVEGYVGGAGRADPQT
jgi:AcrR family transcriptional regulator